MRVIPDCVDFLPNRLDKVIEAVVTNNVGFNPNKDRPFDHGSFLYVDCRDMPYDKAIAVDPSNTKRPTIETSDTNIMNLHWHLNKLNESDVILPWDEVSRKLLLYTRFEHSVIDMG